MTRSDRTAFVIVGGGLAGARAAEALREEGADGRVMLISDEAQRPYNRPGLSKDFLRGESARDDLFVHPPEWAAQHNVELRTAAAAGRLDVEHRSLTLAGGETVAFERLLLATGSAPRPLPIPGAELENTLLLRDVGDAERIRRVAASAQRAVLVGGGFIGAEVAASLTQLGVHATVVTPAAVLWEHLFGPHLAGVFQRKLTDKGVRVLLGESVARIEGHGRVERVVTQTGSVLECDMVVVGVGATPRVGLAHGTPIALDGGVVTDEHLRTTAPGIYAAGDIAAFWSPLYGKRLRVEHWDVAEKHGRIAGRNMAREAAGAGASLDAFAEPPYFFSDLFDLAMEYLGHNEGFEETIVRGDAAAYEHTGFYVRDGRLVAALFVNRNADVDPTRRLIQERLRVDDRTRRHLADPLADLSAL